MADFSMWGPKESGTRLYEQDQIKNFLSAVEGAQGVQETRLRSAQAAKLEQDAASQKKLAELASGRDRTKPIEGQLEDLAQSAMDAGLYEKGAKIAEDASQIRSHKASAASAAALERKRRAEVLQDGLETFGAAMGQATDEASFNRANAIYALKFGAPPPWSGAYSPQLARSLSQSALSKKEQLELAMRAAEDADERETRRSLRDFRTFRKGILERDSELKVTREERLAKAGGGKEKGVASPSKDETAKAEALVKGEFPELPKDERGAAGYDIAARARALRKANSALDASQALQQAFVELKPRFEKVREPYKAFGVEVPGVNKTRQGYKRPLAGPTVDANLKAAVEKAGGVYEPEKYDYRVVDGKTQRKLKAAPVVEEAEDE